jgi:hypothetical protein
MCSFDTSSTFWHQTQLDFIKKLGKISTTGNIINAVTFGFPNLPAKLMGLWAY